MSANHFIGAWRRVKGLSQRRLADRLEMSYANLSRIESGKQAFTEGNLLEIAHALGVEPADLLRPPPAQEDLPLWTVVQGLAPGKKRQALKILQALAEEDAAA